MTRRIPPKRVRMSLGARSYDVQIGSGAIAQTPKWLKKTPSKRAFVISDEKLTRARESTVGALSRDGWEVHEIPVQAGESLKDIEAVYPIYGKLLDGKANRESVIFALGGGSIGDAAGFIASTYLRGIAWVGLPTTLLSQVDSSVGGKTGINHTSGKNLIGTFHQPCLVVCDTDFLSTLSRREVVSGLGEVIKYGFIFDPRFLVFLQKNTERILALDSKVLSQVVRKSIQWKCRAVARDEHDRKGVREVLNFGHTFGHALEAVTGYSRFQHGEAVIWGMRFALALSCERRRLKRAEWVSMDGFLKSLEVPALPSDFGPAEFIARMVQDKKVRDGRIHFVLLREAGRTVSDGRVKESEIVAAFHRMAEGQKS